MTAGHVGFRVQGYGGFRGRQLPKQGGYGWSQLPVPIALPQVHLVKEGHCSHTALVHLGISLISIKDSDGSKHYPLSYMRSHRATLAARCLALDI